MAAFVVLGAEVYLGVGLVVALVFAVIGLPRAMHPVTWGARVLILPGGALLWPYLLTRWRSTR
jgi:hypothetical protein